MRASHIQYHDDGTTTETSYIARNESVEMSSNDVQQFGHDVPLQVALGHGNFITAPAPTLGD